MTATELKNKVEEYKQQLEPVVILTHMGTPESMDWRRPKQLMEILSEMAAILERLEAAVKPETTGDCQDSV